LLLFFKKEVLAFALLRDGRLFDGGADQAGPLAEARLEDPSLVAVSPLMSLHRNDLGARRMDTNVLVEKNLFLDKNDKIRIDILRDMSAEAEANLLVFLRRINASHLYRERMVPVAKTDDALLFVAVIDRAWPPWGLGARTVHGVCQVHRVGENSFSIGPVLVADEDLTNIGLQAAIYKEVLDYVAGEPEGEVGYLLSEGSVLAHATLGAAGFQRTADFILSEHGRYNAYRASADEVQAALGMSDLSSADFLAYQVDTAVFERNALFQASLQLGMRAGLSTAFLRAEVMAIEGLLSGAALPGGVNTPSRGPIREEDEIERDEIGIERDRIDIERREEDIERKI